MSTWVTDDIVNTSVKYYRHLFQGQVLYIGYAFRRVSHALLKLFSTAICTKNLRFYSLVTVDQKGQLEKERTLESSAWLRLIMSSNDFTLETISLSFSSGSSNLPF